MLATSTGDPGPARTLLESKGRDHNGRDTSLTAIFLEQGDKLPASLIRAVRHSKRFAKGLVADIAQVEIGRVPSSGMDTAVHPVNVSIRTGFMVGLGCHPEFNMQIDMSLLKNTDQSHANYRKDPGG